MDKVVAFVHAKRESERFPEKNLRILGGIPLFCHAILNALQSELVDRVVIDSEDEDILRIGEGFGATPMKRPPYLASNKVTGDDLAFWQAGNYPNSEIVLQVVPTCPFIKAETIDKAIRLLKKLPDINTVFSCQYKQLYLWSAVVLSVGDNVIEKYIRPEYLPHMPLVNENTVNDRIPNSDQLHPTIIEVPGLYAIRTKYVLESKRRMDYTKVITVELDDIEAIDINYKEDLEFARVIWKGLNGETKRIS